MSDATGAAQVPCPMCKPDPGDYINKHPFCTLCRRTRRVPAALAVEWGLLGMSKFADDGNLFLDMSDLRKRHGLE